MSVDSSQKVLGDDQPLYVLLIGMGAELDALENNLEREPAVQAVEQVDNGDYAFSLIRAGRVNTIFIDPFSVLGGLDEAAYVIFNVRAEFPEIVIVLFVDNHEVESKHHELFSNERERLRHYYRLNQNISSESFVSELKTVLQRCQNWHRAIHKKRPATKTYQYDVALSFAGEDRHYAEEIAEILKAHGVRVFYDSYELADLWGKNLYTHLHEIYSKKSRFCLLLVSAAYAKKMWTGHEREAAQERTLKNRGVEYILPVRIDDTELEGLPSTVAYVDIRQSGPRKISELFIRKLGGVLGTLE